MLNPAISSCSQCPLGVAPEGACPFRPIRIQAGSILIAQGDRSPNAHFVRDGLLSLAATDEDGDERALGLRGPGAVVGMEAMQGQPSPVEVRAFSATTVCRISGEELSLWLGPPNSPARAVVDLLLRELGRRHNDQELTQGKAVARVARLALALADSPWFVPKQVAARMLGIRAETFSRCLRRLENLEALAWGKSIHVQDRQRLQSLASGGLGPSGP